MISGRADKPGAFQLGNFIPRRLSLPRQEWSLSATVERGEALRAGLRYGHVAVPSALVRNESLPE